MRRMVVGIIRMLRRDIIHSYKSENPRQYISLIPDNISVCGLFLSENSLFVEESLKMLHAWQISIQQQQRLELKTAPHTHWPCWWIRLIGTRQFSYFSYSSRNWRNCFQISLSLLDWTFLPLVNQLSRWTHSWLRSHGFRNGHMEHTFLDYISTFSLFNSSSLAPPSPPSIATCPFLL